MSPRRFLAVLAVVAVTAAAVTLVLHRRGHDPPASALPSPRITTATVAAPGLRPQRDRPRPTPGGDSVTDAVPPAAAKTAMRFLVAYRAWDVGRRGDRLAARLRRDTTPYLWTDLRQRVTRPVPGPPAPLRLLKVVRQGAVVLAVLGDQAASSTLILRRREAGWRVTAIRR